TGREGIFVEAGCAAGGSAIVMASAKAASRPLFVYDVFGMIPAPSARDGDDVHERWRVIREGRSEGIGGRRYYGDEDDLVARVREGFATHGVDPDEDRVHLCHGRLEETMRV